MADYWGWFTKIGASAGLLSLFYTIIKDSIKQIRKPKLKMNYKTDKAVKVWTEEKKKWVRNAATIDVTVLGKETAYRCIAKMEIQSSPKHFHSSEPDYTLHWAEVSYSKGSTKNLPDDLGPEGRRLDVVFTDEQQNIPGCWISIPLALRGSLDKNQAYLPPGVYEVKISIISQNGKGDTERYKILSPKKWQYLQMVRLGEKFKPIELEKMDPESSSLSSAVSTSSFGTGMIGSTGTTGSTNASGTLGKTETSLTSGNSKPTSYT